MTNLIGDCAIESARIILMDESVLTRVRVDEAGIASMGETTALAKGDPRLAKLETLLKDLLVAPAQIDGVDMRMLVSAQCTDGSTRSIGGSMRGDDGMFVKAGDAFYMAPASLRTDLEALLR